MDVELRFKNAGRDAIGYLTVAGAPEDGGLTIKSPDEYQMFVREGMEASNRERQIFILDSMEAARAVVLATRSGTNSDLAISEVADDVFAVSITSFDGNYDDGIPLIVDLREYGRPLTLLGEFPAPGGVNVEISNGDLELIDLKEDQSPEMAM
jgi:hypothetical protein